MNSSFSVTVLVRTRETRLVDSRLSASMNRRYPQVDAAARGWVELEFIVEGRTMAEACEKASAMTRTVSGSNPISCRVVAYSENDLEPAPARFGGRHAAPGERNIHSQALG